jgi:hypothetical protein
VTTKARKRKTTREHEVEDKYRPRLHRSVGVYLALKAWTHGIDCIVLSRKELLQFFDMKVTTGDRMGRIKMDLKPWFRGFMPSCPRPNNRTFVNFLFLGRRVKDTTYLKAPLFRKGVQLLIEQLNKSDDPGAPKTAFFSQIASEGGVPTQEKLLSELVLLASGLEPPNVKEAVAKVKEANSNRNLLNFAQIESPPASGGTNVPNS